ncbi:MAG: hypothetical protein NW224_19010 [Leptolyngbyaceae cyanobacterium bins.302]|nr:hypothetical protein [Leptolyngbyaceae cyanobacterium bins.302]
MQQQTLDLVQQAATQLGQPLYFLWWFNNLMNHAELEGLTEPSSDEIRDPDMDVFSYPYRFICSDEEIAQDLEGAEPSPQLIFHPESSLTNPIQLTETDTSAWFDLPEHELDLKTWLTGNGLCLLTLNNIPKAVCQPNDMIGRCALEQAAIELHELYAPKKPEPPMTFKSLLNP